MYSLKNYRVNKHIIKEINEKGLVYKDYPLKIKVFHPVKGIEGEGNKLAFVVRKKSAAAVLRNKVRRTLREIFLKEESNFKKASWVLVELHPTVLDTSLTPLKKTFNKLLRFV